MISLIIPTLNAERYISGLLNSINEQTVKVDEVLLVDSSSIDNTQGIAKSFGAKIITINKNDFNHGGTRNFAVKQVRGDILVFLTQDAIFASREALSNLIGCFADLKVGAAYGRQLPRQGANAIEAHARLFNYPATSQVKSMTDAPRFGIKTIFFSNSFAAYRRHALKEVTGFPNNTILNEDTYVAAKMLLSGWKVTYCAEAMVFHSHNYGFIEEFKRYFDIGVFHATQPWIRQTFGQAEDEGKRYIRSELKYLWNKNPMLIPSALWRTVLKLSGYNLGGIERYLPIWVKRRLSLHRNYWIKT